MNRINSKKNNRKEAKKLNQEKSENKRFSFFKLIVKILFIIVLEQKKLQFPMENIAQFLVCK